MELRGKTRYIYILSKYSSSNRVGQYQLMFGLAGKKDLSFSSNYTIK